MIIVSSRVTLTVHVKNCWFAILSRDAIADYPGYVDEQATFFIVEKEPRAIQACWEREIRGSLQARGF